MDKKKYGKQMWIIIPIVSFTISLIYSIGYQDTELYLEVIGIISNIILTTGLWIGCFTIVNILWRKYPWEIHPIKHLLIEIAAILIYTNTFVAIMTKVALTYIYKDEIDYDTSDLVQNFLVTNLITVLITAIHEASYFYKQWKEHFSKSAKLEKDNIQAKYETLKSQINPHFLFNSLNSLTHIVDDNSEAVDYIDNLSEFLRYGLKSRDRELVLVRDEVQMLEKYIRLQKARFKNNLHFKVDIEESKYHYSLPPLVLQMLVENCVKHNVISKKNPLSINISTQKNNIHVENNLQLKESATSTGQGLKNIKDRFAFFTTNEVKIVAKNNTFKVEIPLLQIEL